VSSDASAAYGWSGIVGEPGVRIDRFGASADCPILYTVFGITAERVVDEVMKARA